MSRKTSSLHGFANKTVDGVLPPVVNEIRVFFEKNPDRLVNYVQSAVEGGYGILSLHLEQLARMVGLSLRSDSRVVMGLPLSFVNPKGLDNIAEVVRHGRAKFTGPVVR